jgi:hypothetical protein
LGVGVDLVVAVAAAVVVVGAVVLGGVVEVVVEVEVLMGAPTLAIVAWSQAGSDSSTVKAPPFTSDGMSTGAERSLLVAVNSTIWCGPKENRGISATPNPSAATAPEPCCRPEAPSITTRISPPPHSGGKATSITDLEGALLTGSAGKCWTSRQESPGVTGV